MTPVSNERLPPSASDLEQLEGALHEVSNTLTVVVGWLDRALAGRLDPELKRALSIARARALDGRDISRSAIGARSLSSVQQTLAALLDEAILGVLPEANSRGVHVTLLPMVGGPALIEDARVALQILTNLLLNGVAFSPRGGEVEVSAQIDRGDVVVRVLDQGPGLPAERRANPFERGASSREGGAGIGLAHAHDLASQHGGELTLEASSSGACFALRWPCAPPRSSVESPPRPSIALRSRRVLLIEDDASILELLEIALSARGADVLSVSEPHEIRAAIAQAPFDVVLVDWSPIALEARPILSAIRAACPDAPLVAISGSAVIVDTEALSLCSAWVRKPFELSEILGAVATALSTK